MARAKRIRIRMREGYRGVLSDEAFWARGTEQVTNQTTAQELERRGKAEIISDESEDESDT